MIWRITDLGRCYKVCIVLISYESCQINDCLIMHSFIILVVFLHNNTLTSCRLSSIDLPGFGLSIWTEVSFILSDTLKKKKKTSIQQCVWRIPAFHRFMQFSHERNSAISSSKVIEYQRWALLTLYCFRGSLHDTGTTFAPARVHSGSLSHGYICLHDTTTKCHAGTSHSSLQFNPVMLYWSENFIQGWNMYVNAKQPTMLVSNQSAGGLEWLAHAKWLQFWITNVFYQDEVYLQITEINEMTHHHVNTIQNHSHPRASWSFLM